MNEAMLQAMADMAAKENRAMREVCGIRGAASPRPPKKAENKKRRSDVAFMAALEGEPKTADQVASALGVGRKYAQMSLKRLTKAGMVKPHPKPGNVPWLYEAVA
jgi:predicted Rossmann fold nucleotide-binding protein DprA/Smf involved in DNA uptake